MESFVTIEIYHSPIDAEVARDFMEQSGIRAYLLDDHTVAAYGLLNSALGGVKLQVSAADESTARRLLQEVKAKRKPVIDCEPVAFQCTSCDGRLEFPGHRRGGVETCLHCGAYVDVPGTDDETHALGSTETALTADCATVPTTQRLPLHVEILGVLSFVYLPHFVAAMSSSGGGTYSFVEFMQLFIASLQSTIPLLLILVLLGEGLPKFGVTRPQLLRDTLIGLGLAVAITAASVVRNIVFAVNMEPLPDAFAEAGMILAPPPLLEPGAFTLLWCCLSVVANSVAEELCMRGYLLTRLVDLWGSRVWAVLVSALLFGSYHMYQGPEEAVWIALEGCVFGVSFLVLKSIWPLVIAHTLINLYVFLTH